MTCCPFGETARPHSRSKRPLYGALVVVVPTLEPGSSFLVDSRGREHPLPSPVPACIRKLAIQSVGERSSGQAAREIPLELRLHSIEVRPQRSGRHTRKRDAPVLVALPATDRDFTPRKVHVLHSQRDAFRNSEPTPVHQDAAQARDAAQPRQDQSYFANGQHHRETTS